MALKILYLRCTMYNGRTIPNGAYGSSKNLIQLHHWKNFTKVTHLQYTIVYRICRDSQRLSSDGVACGNFSINMNCFDASKYRSFKIENLPS